MPRPSAKTSGAVAVTTASQVLIPENRSRRYLLLVNNSDADVTIQLRTANGLNSVDPVAVAGAGMVLKAAGAGAQPLRIDEYDGPVAFIHAGVGAKSVGVVEV